METYISQDYDRVFSSMGIPACLWRRTGEIYRGNKEFAQLVNVPIEMLREVSNMDSVITLFRSIALIDSIIYSRGDCAYTSLWPKNLLWIIGRWIFSRCTLTFERCTLNSHACLQKYGNIAFDAGQKAVLTSCLLKNPDPENTSVMSCCFSFTIRRDKYNIPVTIDMLSRSFFYHIMLRFPTH